MGAGKFIVASIAATFAMFSTVAADAAPLPKLSAAEVATRMKVYDHTPLSPSVKPAWNFIGSDLMGCSRYAVELPVDGQNYRFVVHMPFQYRAIPVVIHVPTIEGYTTLEDELGAEFCSREVAFIMADVQPNDVADALGGPAALRESMIRAVRAMRTMVDHLHQNQKPELMLSGGIPYQTSFDLNRISTLGISNGTITAAMTAAADSRIHSTLLFALLSNVPHALAYSENSKVEQIRRNWMSSLGITSQSALETHLRSVFDISPMDVTELLKVKRVHQILINSDRIAPDVDQLAFYQEMDGEPNYTAQARGSWGHVPTIVMTVLFDIGAIAGFF